MSGRGRSMPSVMRAPVVVLKPSVPPTSVNTTQIPANNPWGQPPPGYIPGRGRGATGFSGGVSRDDASSANTGGPVICAEGSPWAADREDYSESKFDVFSGFQENLFADTVLDDEDREAEKVFDTVEQLLDQRRKRQRDLKFKEQVQKTRTEKSTLQQTFSDLKKSLTTVTPEEWDALPDIGEVRGRRKKKLNWNREAPMPDKYLGLGGTSYDYNIAPLDGDGAATPLGLATPLLGTQTPLSLGGADSIGPMASGARTPAGLQTPFGMQTPYGMQTPFGMQTPYGGSVNGMASGIATASVPTGVLLTETKGAALGCRLDAVKSGAMSTIADPQGYLTQLDATNSKDTNAEVKDLKKTRALMKSIVATNPTNPSGWVAYAKMELGAGRSSKARDVIAQGCLHCSTAEEVWLEAANMQATRTESDEWLAAGLSKIPSSVKLWQRRAALRDKTNTLDGLSSRRELYHEALETVTNSVNLWREAANEEAEEDACILLTRAVQCLPQSAPLWLDLVERTSDIELKKKILNEAGRKCPTSLEIWLAAIEIFEEGSPAKLVPSAHRSSIVGATRMVSRAIKRLEEFGQILYERSAWLKIAIKAEVERGKILTAWSIIEVIGELTWRTVKETDGTVDVAKFKNDRLVEVDQALENKAKECALALVRDALKFLPQKKAFWKKMLDLVADNAVLRLTVLEEAVEAVPKKPIFWSLLAEHHQSTSVSAAREVLARAVLSLPDNDDLLFRKIKLDARNGAESDALAAIDSALQTRADCARLWKHKASILRRLGRVEESADVVAEGLMKCADCPELWLIKSQMKESNARVEVLEAAIKVARKSDVLWANLIYAYIEINELGRARACREKATIILPASELIWLAGLDIEKRLATQKVQGIAVESNAKQLITRALKNCPQSGLLWYEAVLLEPQAARGARVVEALKATNNNIYAILAASRLFQAEGKPKKAREWFSKAVHQIGPSNGDAFIMYLSFLSQNLTRSSVQERDNLLTTATKRHLNEGVRWWLPFHKNPANAELSLKDQLYAAAQVYERAEES